MRDKDWVEIHPRIPDRDAILCPSFFKSAKNGSQTVFKGGKAIVQFHIPNNVYVRYEAWIEEHEFQKLFPDESVDHSVSVCMASNFELKVSSDVV